MSMPGFPIDYPRYAPPFLVFSFFSFRPLTLPFLVLLLLLLLFIFGAASFLLPFWRVGFLPTRRGVGCLRRDLGPELGTSAGPLALVPWCVLLCSSEARPQDWVYALLRLVLRFLRPFWALRKMLISVAA